ncbi:uncharacterized protein LOC119083283 [Bradysia coprophila]|uniref:uncharacterized protein LOC119083283 n=1 Tax=Bradysia coprophila TaxID=38358 RepID=UPI00187D7A2F|nr:uncharacterized protein LOC119083283 [Bradysia coprophila]
MEQKKNILRTSSVIGAMKWWSSNNNNKQTFGSAIAGQKLRESKWFGVDETKILCAVIECGFIVETREGQENNGWFGVAICKTSKDKKPKPENVDIYTLKTTERRLKLVKITLAQLWEQGYIVRINNFGDKEKPPHCEKDIKSQVSFAQKAKQELWHNSQHFAYWCRYGHRQQDVRKKQMSECVKWGSVGMNAGMIILMNREKSHSSHT